MLLLFSFKFVAVYFVDETALRNILKTTGGGNYFHLSYIVVKNSIVSLS